ncbi:NADH dehydrogenase [ubiquinone] 1 alpha subcomplex assembly factor3 [Zostera marina]|uniref:NADH dehydrogenase [ubiquinone] 1 alpha subcomplex assembly factor 3 n=1 Tax=Zostera marina TaxID=29655 RepID=A0A0K9PCZ2_ZOSMR|nr:NADH dehydrogenase [ubiquinone] 1 alpha subcomplex assembly factor3 [Zostera marina]
MAASAVGGGGGVRQKAARILPHLIKGVSRCEQTTPNSHNRTLPSLRRAFSLYDQINLIDKVPDDQLRFQKYTDTGFTVNGVEYDGSLLIVNNTVMSWAPKTFSDITRDSLSIFQLLRPIPEILLLGCGKLTQHVSPELRKFIRSTGMKLEAIDSRNAASTYNILNEEDRIVAAALLPYGVLT